MKIGVDRIHFYRDTDMDSQVSIDIKLQKVLQHIVDMGGTVITVQQTHEERAQPGRRETYVKWAEFLIVSSTP